MVSSIFQCPLVLYHYSYILHSISNVYVFKFYNAIPLWHFLEVKSRIEKIILRIFKINTQLIILDQIK